MSVLEQWDRWVIAGSPMGIDGSAGASSRRDPPIRNEFAGHHAALAIQPAQRHDCSSPIGNATINLSFGID